MDVAAISSSMPAAGSPHFAESVNRLPAADQRRVVAQQFEAILLRQLLGPALDKLPGAGNGVYGYLLTDAMAQKLSTGHGLGFASLLERQFTPPGAPISATTPKDPALPAATSAHTP